MRIGYALCACRFQKLTAQNVKRQLHLNHESGPCWPANRMLATGSWVPNPAGRPSEQSKTGNGGQQPFPHDSLREVLGQCGQWGVRHQRRQYAGQRS